MIKLLIVDDSALMRRYISQLFADEHDFTLETARNGAEALVALERFNPDVITLDINMPEMDGLTCLANIMTSQPKPVIMLSSLTEEGAEATFEALELGAVDFVHKPGGTISLNLDRIAGDLKGKVRAAASSRLRRSQGLSRRLRNRRPAELPAAARTTRVLPQIAADRMGVVLMGVSTGGPGTLEQILPQLPADFAWPVVIAQHMPASFTTVFARRLGGISALPVAEVTGQTLLEPATVYIARGGADLVFSNTGLGLAALPAPSDPGRLWHPSVSRMVESALKVLPPNRLIGVMLTGMGNDGAVEMARLRAAGGRTIAQDEASSIVFGMPGELVRLDGADEVLPAGKIARVLTDWLRIGRG